MTRFCTISLEQKLGANIVGQSCEQEFWRTFGIKSYEQKNVIKAVNKNCEQALRRVWPNVLNKGCEHKCEKKVGKKLWVKVINKDIEEFSTKLLNKCFERKLQVNDMNKTC